MQIGLTELGQLFCNLQQLTGLRDISTGNTLVCHGPGFVYFGQGEAQEIHVFL